MPDTCGTVRARLCSCRLAALLLLPGLSGCVSYVPDDQAARGLERGGWQQRYFRYDGEFEYLVGFDIQQLHADPGIDYREKLKFLAAHDINKIRLWLYPSWFGLPGDRNYPTDGEILYPWQVDERTNRFDIDSWDPAFWARTRDVLAFARELDIVVEISLFSIQEPRNYFRREYISYAFHHEDNLQEFGRPTDPNGGFMRGFFALGYTDNEQSLAAYQKALIDKAIEEFGKFGNVYYELINEAPGERYWIEHELPHAWIKYWLRYIAGKTTQPVTTHSSGFMSLTNNNEKGWTRADFAAVGSRYWDEEYVDGFNFHFYSSDPQLISDSLNVYQRENLMLICNEGGAFYEIDRTAGYPNFRVDFDRPRLYDEIRHAWAMMTAGGYYSIYYGPVPLLGDEASREAARSMQAMRHIVESVRFETLRPVRPDGTEFDDLVSGGPGDGWQVIADPGRAYLVYFWGEPADGEVSIALPAGRYRYSWRDTRGPAPPISRGRVDVGRRAQTGIPAPTSSTWDPRAGIVLVIDAG